MYKCATIGDSICMYSQCPSRLLVHKCMHSYTPTHICTHTHMHTQTCTHTHTQRQCPSRLIHKHMHPCSSTHILTCLCKPYKDVFSYQSILVEKLSAGETIDLSQQ